MALTKTHTIMHVVASFNERDGGPARYISELCGECVARGHRVALFTVAAPDDKLMGIDPRVRVKVVFNDHAGAAAELGQAVTVWVQQNPEGLVHLHGLWRREMHAAAMAAHRSGRPTVWAPMGMLEPWARQHRRWKKQLAWWLYQRRDLQRAMVLHATSQLEAEGLRQAGLTGSAAIIPLGVAPPPERRPLPAVTVQRTALFLSRVHPKKGLLMLLEAWAALRPFGWHLVIAGNDENGHAAEVSAAIVRLGLSPVVTMAGPVFGEAKEQLFREAQLFVLPSHSENFGVVVAEALVRGLPVLTTTGTPWPELVDRRAGWWVEPAVSSIQAALAEATRLAPEQLQAWGQRGAVWASTQFSWGGIVERMEQLYTWMAANDTAKPAFVQPLKEPASTGQP